MPDTDTLIALVNSLLTTNPSHENILQALVDADGNVQDAADALNSKMTSASTKRNAATTKRKRQNLDAWVKKSKPAQETTVIYVDSEEDDVKPLSLPSNKLASSSGGPGQDRSSKPVIDLMAILRPPPSSDKGKCKVTSLSPLTLTNPSMVATHTPCTLHLSVLPPELACQLFYTMMEESTGWKRNKWWLFGRMVESPHRTSFYARLKDDDVSDEATNEWREAAQYWYNGRPTDTPKHFPPEMERACTFIEKIVNEELRKRKRYPLEYGSDKGSHDTVWKANVAASNCYEGSKESVGFHSDQLTHLGPYPTIASLSLGTTRVFRLREVIPNEEADIRQARTFNIPLPHNSLTIMHASCQEKFKHSIPPQTTIDIFHPPFPPQNPDHYNLLSTPGPSTYPTSNCRINITFRFFRPDFRPNSIPRCKCNVPAILRPDMKNRTDGETDKYWWTCHAGAQNEGKGCKFWKVLDMKEDGRGPCVGDADVPI